MSRVRRFLLDDRGATAIEYCLIATFVSMTIIAGATLIGVHLRDNYFGPVATGLN